MTKLIQDCLTELKDNEEVNNSFNEFSYIGTYDASWEDLYEYEQVLFTQALLSRVDGKAVMKFLDVLANEQITEIRGGFMITGIYLDHLLYREFTEALRVGKSLEEALEIINKIYIDNI